MKWKKQIAALLAAVFAAVLPGAAVPALADDTAVECAVIGADLTNAQTEQVYAAFGMARGTVQELSMTNAEERAYLEGLVEDSVIGTASISCVYIKLLPEGSGTDVSVSNISWCTEEMYRSALATAGITDVKAVVTAPFSVSGTAALAGIYKAYEALTARTLDEDAKQAGTQELVTTADLADELGDSDATSIVGDLKSILDETKDMTDEELSDQIRAIAEGYNVTLNDGQVRQLLNLCRQLEKISDSKLAEGIENLQETARRLGELGEKAQEAKETAGNVLDTVKDFFAKIGEFFSNLFK